MALIPAWKGSSELWTNWTTNPVKGRYLTVMIIGPESDHCLSLSVTPAVTHSLTHSCLVNLIDVTLASEDTNSKLVDIVTVANVDDEDCIGNSLLQIWELRIVHKAKLLFRL